MRNISVDFFFNLDQWFRMRCHLKNFLSRPLMVHTFAKQTHLSNLIRGYYVLNLDQWFRRRRRLKMFPIYSSGDPYFRQSGTISNFSRGHYEKHFCKSILNLKQWFRRGCRLTDFLSTALVTHTFGQVEPLVRGKNSTRPLVITSET